MTDIIKEKCSENGGYVNGIDSEMTLCDLTDDESSC